MVGSGISIDEYIDFEVDNTGDIGTTDGVDELVKDLSISIKSAVSQSEYNTVLTANEREKVSATITEALQSDPRVSSVQRVRVRRDDDQNIAATAQVIADDETLTVST